MGGGGAGGGDASEGDASAVPDTPRGGGGGVHKWKGSAAFTHAVAAATRAGRRLPVLEVLLRSVYPGQVAVTSEAWLAAQDDLPEGIALVDLGRGGASSTLT